MTLVIHDCDYLIRSPEKIERNSDLLIEGNRIRSIGKEIKIPAGAEIIDGKNCVVMPGLINPHTHLYQNMIKGIAPGLELVPWCNQVLFPTVGAIRKLTGEAKKRVPYLWTALGSMEMIRGGITCCVNMDVTTPEGLQAWSDVGFRGVLAYTLSNKWVPANLRSTESEMKRKALQFVDEFHHPDNLTTVFMAPSTLFLCTDEFIRWIAAQAVDRDLGIQIHIAETSGEVNDMIKETGKRAVHQLKYLGILEYRLSAVHCVHINQEEVALLAEAGAKVVHCPKSNMKLADGAAPVARMRAAGISVSIATDGCASNDLLDMWEEMRAAVMLARVSENNAFALSPRNAFRMATIEAARAARVDAGELEPGKLADVAVVDLKANHLQPFHDDDILNSLVFCGKAGDVRDTIIHGQVVMRNRKIKNLSEDDLLEEASSYTKMFSDLRAGYSAN